MRPPSTAPLTEALARIIPRRCPIDQRSIEAVVCDATAAKVTFRCGHTGFASVSDEGATFAMRSPEVPFS